jgi:hypothetical protein
MGKLISHCFLQKINWKFFVYYQKKVTYYYSSQCSQHLEKYICQLYEKIYKKEKVTEITN